MNKGRDRKEVAGLLQNHHPPAPPAHPVWTPRVPQGALFDGFCSRLGGEPGWERLLQEAAGDRQAPLEICATAKEK